MRAKAGVKRKKAPAPPPEPENERSKFTGPPRIPKKAYATLIAVGNALTAGLLKSLLWRLQAGTCEHCGYDGLSTSDLQLVHKVLLDNDFKKLADAARAEAATDGPVEIDFELPEFTEPALLPEGTPGS
jgi:hypothetical protein